MSKKETFISEIQEIIDRIKTTTGEDALSEDAMTYFEALTSSNDKEKKMFTDNGKLVLQFMKDNKDNFSNLFTAKSIGEGAGITSRTASGALRKLVTDGYVEKLGESPVSYSLTSRGVEVAIPAE